MSYEVSQIIRQDIIIQKTKPIPQIEDKIWFKLENKTYYCKILEILSVKYDEKLRLVIHYKAKITKPPTVHKRENPFHIVN